MKIKWRVCWRNYVLVVPDNATIVIHCVMYYCLGVKTDCSLSTMNVTVTLKDDFQGAVYARGFPLECRALGSHSPSVTLQLAASGCGVRITPNSVTKLIYFRLLEHFSIWRLKFTERHSRFHVLAATWTSLMQRGRPGCNVAVLAGTWTS